MANNFSDDSNCVAVYRFENDVTDSKGNNDLTNSGVSFDSTRKEGSYAGAFTASQFDYAEITNADLDSGFPGKNGESFTSLSIAIWVRLQTNALYQAICGIWNGTAALRGWVVRFNPSTHSFSFLKGYNAGASYEQFDHGWGSVATGVWYHLQISYLEATKTLLFGVWDDTYAGYRQVGGNDFDTEIFSQGTAVPDEEFNLGRFGQASTYLDGLLDELVVFKDVVSASEFAAIRAGTYAAATLAVADLLHVHSLDNVALTQANTLAVADLAHAHSLDNVALTQAHALAVADLAHGHSLDNVALTQANTLAVADLAHAHSLDNVSLSMALTLAVADMLHGHSLDGIALTQAHTLAVADLAHGHGLDNVTLSTAIMLIVADLSHAHSLDSMALTQAHVLAVGDLAHGHSLDNVLLLLLDTTPLITFTGKTGVFEFTGKTGTFTFTAK